MSVGRRTLPPWALAAVLGAATFLLTGADLRQHYRIDPGVPLALSLGWTAVVVAAVLLAGRRVAPPVVLVLALGIEAVAAVGTVPVSTDEPWPWSVGATGVVLVVLVALGFRTGRSRRPVLAAAWVVTQVTGAVVIAEIHDLGGWSDLVPMAVLSALAVVIAELVGQRRTDRLTGEAHRRAAALALEERRRADERRELAHELHDVVAHHLSVVVVRADSAPVRVDGLDDAARAEFAAIGDDARVCLEQMRRVLRVLESGDAAAAPVTPQPGLDDLPALVAGARSGGANVDLDLEVPDAHALAPLTGLAAYRVAQEALTNALRHAPGAPVRLAVRDDGGSLVVEVENAAGGTGVASGGGDGRGIRGMRERVGVVDGDLEVGPTTAGGFRVRAVLPRSHAGRTEVSR